MADGVAVTTKVKVHQALHGYAEGHRQLAASVSLKPRDARTLLVLSDISGPGARLDEAGYLTGYPLTDAGVYAFARTWPAPEMSRPGCVWTHTLLIDFADLAAVNSMTELLNTFRRPGSDPHEGFGKPIALDLSRIDARIDESDAPIARKIVAALYGKSTASVISARPVGCDVERLITVLWSQQWPRLRRAFRFCTLSAADRSADGARFDLQFLPGNNQALRTRFPEAVDAEDSPQPSGWLDEAIADLVWPRPEGLRAFLRRVGVDVPGGRSAFRSLCQLYRFTREIGFKRDALEGAIQLLEGELGDAPARAARLAVAAAALPRAEQLSDAGLDYLLDHLSTIETSLVEASAGELGRAILQRRPAALDEMLKADGALGQFAENVLLRAPESDLLAAMRGKPEIGLLLLKHRPQLAATPSVWSQDLRAEESALAALRVLERPRPVVTAMMKAGRTDLAERAAGEAGALEVLLALSSLMGSESLSRGDCEAWLRAAVQPSAVAQLLTTSAEGQPRQLLALLARLMRPDEVPNDYGEDPWLSAFQHAWGSTSDADETQLRAFLLARSLGWKSRNQAELAQVAFEYTHDAAAVNRLPDGSWRLLDPLLPWSFLSFDWDHCQRLRAGVVELFVGRRLAPEVFGRLVQNGSLFELLAKQAARTWAGRKYLKDVSRALAGVSDGSYSGRRRYIKTLLE